jgi:small subunit ribosomal protein S17
MRKTLIGTVTSDKTAKTRRVEVERLYRHPKYGKIVKARTVCHVHDEKNETAKGDAVEIGECRPRSALKRWELVRIIKKANPLSAEINVDAVENAAGK